MLQVFVKFSLLILTASRVSWAGMNCKSSNQGGNKGTQMVCEVTGENNRVIRVSPINGANRVNYIYSLTSGIALLGLCKNGLVYKTNSNQTKPGFPNDYPIASTNILLGLGLRCELFTLDSCTTDGIVIDCSKYVSIILAQGQSPAPTAPLLSCSSSAGARCDDQQTNRCCKNSANTLFCLSTQKCGICEALNVPCGPGPYNAPCCGDASCIIPAASGADELQPAVCTSAKCAKFNESCNTDGTNNCCAPYMCNQYFTPQKEHVFICGSPLPYCVARNQNTYWRGQPDDVSVCTGTSKLPARCCSGVCVPARNGTSPPPASATFGSVVGDAAVAQPTGVCSCSLKGSRCDDYSSCCSTSPYSCGSDFKCIY